MTPRDTPDQPRKPTRNPLTRPVARWVGVAVLASVLGLSAWLWRDVRTGVIVSDSMSPTLVKGDTYVIRIDAYRRTPPQRGDVVVIKHPKSDQLLVKRVVAVGGDTVEVMSGRVWLNGEWLEEPYLLQQLGIRERPVGGRVPPGELMVLGDNRNDSEDSRDIGAIPVENVMGRVAALILPLARRGRLDGRGLVAPGSQ